MKRLMLALALLSGASQSNATSVESCAMYADLVRNFLELRQEGADRQTVSDMLEEQGLLIQPIRIAMIKAWSVDGETDSQQLQQSAYKRCRAGEF